MYLFDNVSVLLEMRGGDEESCQYQFCNKKNVFNEIHFKMGSDGGLDSVATIKMIEMVTKGDLEQMQSGFGAYDECKPDGRNTQN
jgi:hypothetical protein